VTPRIHMQHIVPACRGAQRHAGWWHEFHLWVPEVVRTVADEVERSVVHLHFEALMPPLGDKRAAADKHICEFCKAVSYCMRLRPRRVRSRVHFGARLE